MSDQFAPVTPAPVSDKKGLAIASLVLGILSLCGSIVWFCGAPLSIIGLVLGFLGLKSTSKNLAIAGIVLSGLGLLLMIVFVVISLVSGPVFQNITDALQTGY